MPFQKLQEHLNLSAISIKGNNEENIQQAYTLGKFPSGPKQEGQAGQYVIPISRGARSIGELRLLPKQKQELNPDFLLLVANIIAQPLHQWIKSRGVKLTGTAPHTFLPKAMIAYSRPMVNIFNMVSKVVDTNTTILILGESGAGKERVANEIHFQGGRKNRPFVSVNCAAIPQELIESELFGHKKGAFTGAHQDRQGKFEQADGGTLFLDEVGDLSLEAQSKLLRALQDKTITKVGGNQSKRYDVRVIAATNIDLQERVEQGLFREDLFYRLNVFPITVPPLRQRKDDIIPLTNYFVSKFSREVNKNIKRVSTSALDMLMAYHWPGNVRELANTIERAILMSDNGVIQGQNLPPSLQMPDGNPTQSSLEQSLNQLEQDMIIDALKSCGGNMRKASELLGTSERKMGLRIQRYNIDLKRFKKTYKNVDK